MAIVLNEPVVRTFLKTEKQRRQERRLYLTPTEKLTESERVIIDLALNNTVSEDSVLPTEYEKALMLSTPYYYQVSNTRINASFDKTIFVAMDTNSNRINIYIHNKPNDTYTVKQFIVLVPESSSKFITSNLSKTVYFESAARLSKDKVYQYSESLADVYKLLFHVVFQTDMSGFVDNASIEKYLVDLLEDTEVTLHLNITRTIKLYGTVDEEKFLNLYIREIGTPDTFWTRSVLLQELTSQF